MKLNKLQETELIILKEVDKICKANNITYFLGEGSLLGAIRHKGFIPWDDDIDLLMKRKDYEKFLKIAPKIVNKKFQIQHSTLIENYWSPFIKVRLLDNSIYAQKHISHLTSNNGPLIDIFPLDNVPNQCSFKQSLQGFLIKFYRGMLTYKLGLKKPTKLKGYIVKFFSIFYKVDKIHNNLDYNFKKYNNKNNKYTVNLGSYYSTKKQTMPNEWYSNQRIVNFENMKLPIPVEAEKILQSIYGDYNVLPPEEKRKSKHHF